MCTPKPGYVRDKKLLSAMIHWCLLDKIKHIKAFECLWIFCSIFLSDPGYFRYLEFIVTTLKGIFKQIFHFCVNLVVISSRSTQSSCDLPSSSLIAVSAIFEMRI